MVGQQFLVDAVAEVKERVPHDTVLLQKLDAILSAPLEVVEDLQEFCIRAKALIEHKSQALGGLEAITFPDCLLKSLDAFSAIDILKSIRLPPPLGPLLTKGLDGATLAYMVALAAPFLSEPALIFSANLFCCSASRCQWVWVSCPARAQLELRNVSPAWLILAGHHSDKRALHGPTEELKAGNFPEAVNHLLA